jgi:hypothetical protein
MHSSQRLVSSNISCTRASAGQWSGVIIPKNSNPHRTRRGDLSSGWLSTFVAAHRTGCPASAASSPPSMAFLASAYASTRNREIVDDLRSVASWPTITQCARDLGRRKGLSCGVKHLRSLQQPHAAFPNNGRTDAIIAQMAVPSRRRSPLRSP